jgi:uncharacterized iron-regulated protein
MASLLLSACAADGVVADLRPGPPWLSAHGQGHPLVGRIWVPGEDRFAAPGEVAAALRRARFVLLGEKHDNNDHHRLQAWLVHQLAEAGRRPALAFEMIDSDQEPRIAAHLRKRPRDIDGIGAAAEWGKTGWPPWPDYAVIVEAISVDQPLAILGASLPRAEVRKVVKTGTAALGPEVSGAIGTEFALPADLTAALQEQIEVSHCDMLPDAMVEPMVTMQTIKDALMAATMLRGAARPTTDGAVLIAGGGHVRRDRAVPWHLQRLGANGEIAVVTFIEVDADIPDKDALAAGMPGAAAAFDYVWLTPRVELADPCEQYADSLKKAGKHSQQSGSKN